jgi:signal transduction histidine kinase
VDVAEVIARGYAEYAPIFESEGWQVEKEIEPDLPAVTADAQVLESLLKNLLENALKYAGKGRWLGIHAKSEITRGKTEVQIIVSDRGPGIEPDELPHIFEPFYRGRSRSAGPAASGVGLGLSLVQRHLREMDGRIDVQTAVGQGTVFTMHLPAVKTG